MTVHVGILPIDVLHALSLRLSAGKLDTISTQTLGAHFLRLPHPRTGIPSLFLSYVRPSDALRRRELGKTIILEVHAVAPPHSRSWFIGEEVMADGKLLVMTCIDPVFLLIPILQSTYPDDGTLGNFRPADDIFEEAALKLYKAYATFGGYEALTVVSEKDVLYFTSLDSVKSALKHICDVKEITPEIVVYRFSPSKVIEYLRIKVARLATPEAFEGSRTLVRGLAKDGLTEDGKEDLLQAGRIRAACDLVAQYVPNTLRSTLVASYDLTHLDAYFKTMEDDIAALAIANANSAKTKEASRIGGDKKRKNSKTSQGVEKLKKVNISGMAKLSVFFQKS